MIRKNKMKKLLAAFMALAAVANAGAIVGANVSYSNVDSELTASAGGVSESYTVDTKSKGLTLKAGYEYEEVRVLGYVSSEYYSDDVVVYNEGNAITIGAEADYLIDDLYVGAFIGSGYKDFYGTDIDFIDVGLKIGGTHELSEGLDIEAGVEFKKRSYDNYNYSGTNLDLDEKLIGVFIGLNFNL